MAAKSRGRGAVATFGLILVFAGLVAGGVLYVVGERRPGEAVDGFARAPIGCTTTLEFSETGDFFVYEEVGGIVDVEGCQPIANPETPFDVEFTGDLVPAVVLDDDSVSYDVDGFDGRSVQRITIDEPGQYAVAVAGDDLTVLAALGRDPNDGVDDLRLAALIVALIGGLLGILLLVLSGRRSKQAAVATTPEGPGWSPGQRFDDGAWEPPTVNAGQVPVNPHAPVAPAKAEVPSAPLSGLAPPSASVEDAADAEDEGEEEGEDEAPEPPTLPDSQGRPSGT